MDDNQDTGGRETPEQDMQAPLRQARERTLHDPSTGSPDFVPQRPRTGATNHTTHSPFPRPFTLLDLDWDVEANLASLAQMRPPPNNPRALSWSNLDTIDSEWLSVEPPDLDIHVDPLSRDINEDVSEVVSEEPATAASMASVGVNETGLNRRVVRTLRAQATRVIEEDGMIGGRS